MKELEKDITKLYHSLLNKDFIISDIQYVSALHYTLLCYFKPKWYYIINIQQTLCKHELLDDTVTNYNSMLIAKNRNYPLTEYDLLGQ